MQFRSYGTILSFVLSTAVGQYASAETVEAGVVQPTSAEISAPLQPALSQLQPNESDIVETLTTSPLDDTFFVEANAGLYCDCYCQKTPLQLPRVPGTALLSRQPVVPASDDLKLGWRLPAANPRINCVEEYIGVPCKGFNWTVERDGVLVECSPTPIAARRF